MSKVILELGSDRKTIVEALYSLTDRVFANDQGSDAHKLAETQVAAIDIAIADIGVVTSDNTQVMQRLNQWLEGVTDHLGIKASVTYYQHPTTPDTDGEYLEYRDLSLVGKDFNVLALMAKTADDILNHPQATDNEIYEVIARRVGEAVKQAVEAITHDDERALQDALSSWLISLNMLRFETGIQLRITAVTIIRYDGVSLAVTV